MSVASNLGFPKAAEVEYIHEDIKMKTPKFYGLGGWRWSYFKRLRRVIYSSHNSLESIPKINEPLIGITKEEFELSEGGNYVA